MAKAAFIGAGSVEFTRNVVTDLCSFPELHGELELALHDIDAERFAHAETIAERISAQTGAGAAVTSSVDRLAAIEGADYVVNEIQADGYRPDAAAAASVSNNLRGQESRTRS